MSALAPFVQKIATGSSLTRTEANQAFEIIMSGEASPALIGAFLMGLRVRGETVDEITGAAEVMRAKAEGVTAPPGAVDTCGTGGDGTGTYNISTACAFILAACGVPVAKHGNKSISSKSGSADVLLSLGVNIDVGPDVVAQSIDKTNLGFMFAPKHHAAMRHVGPVRAELATRTIFNLLGPLSNPAKTKRQLIGVFSKDWVEPLAHVLKNLGSEKVWVVHGSDGLDELTTTGPSHVASLENGSIKVFDVSPEEAGLARARMEDLKGGDAEENAEALRGLLDGQAGAYRDIVLFNTAASLIVAGKADDLKGGVKLASEAIDSGAAKAVLEELVLITNA